MNVDRHTNVKPDDWTPDAALRRSQAILFGLMLAGLLGLKFWLNGRVDEFGIDGSYYLDLAGHVRDGDGLVTDASLYHASLPDLPWPSPVQPLWPRMLGLVARLAPLPLVAVWLPTFFYFCSLVLAWRWGRQVWDRPVIPMSDVPHGGHLLALLLALNPEYLEHTSKPYTEGLAFTLLFTFLLRVRACFTAPTALRGLEAGAWLGLLLLCRSQMIVAAAGFGLGMILRLGLVREGRRGTLLAGLASWAGFALVLLPQWLHLRTFVPGLALREMIRFESFQMSGALPKLELLMQHDTLLEWALDRAKGFPIAFKESGKYSYFNQFAAFYWNLPVVLVAGTAEFVRRWRGGERPVGRLIHRLRGGLSPEEGWWLFLAGSAWMWFASIHVLHKDNFTEWNFALRHAIPCLMLFLLSYGWLVQRRGFLQIIATFLLFSSIHILAQRSAAQYGQLRLSVTERQDQAAIAKYLKEQRQLNPDLRVASSLAQEFSALTDGIGYDGLYNATTLRDLRVMFGESGTDLFVIRENQKLKLMKEPEFAATCTMVEPRPERWRVFTCQPLRLTGGATQETP